MGRNINGSAHSGWSTVIVTGTLCTQPSGEVTVAVYTVVLVGLAIGFEIDEEYYNLSQTRIKEATSELKIDF
mgnify:CR=1 FL=1